MRVAASPSLLSALSLNSSCATAAVMLKSVWRNLHSVLDCLWGMGEGLADFGGGNHVQQWGLDTSANIGFGPGHTSGQWVNSPLRQAHAATRPCTGQPAISALHFQQNTNIDTRVLFVAFCDGHRANTVLC